MPLSKFCANEGSLVERLNRISDIETPLAERLGDADLINTFEEEANNASRELSIIQDKAGEITPDCFTLTDLNQSIQVADAETKLLNHELDASNEETINQIAELEAELQNLDPDLLTRQQELSRLVQQINKKIRQYEALEAFFAKTSNPEDLIVDKQASISQIIMDVESLQSDVTLLKGELGDYHSLEQKTKELTQEKEKANNARAAKLKPLN